MEDEFNASIEHQCELNSNMQEVVRVDVMKLLDANIFYSISNICNGESSTGCVYKKKDHGGSKRKQWAHSKAYNEGSFSPLFIWSSLVVP